MGFIMELSVFKLLGLFVGSCRVLGGLSSFLMDALNLKWLEGSYGICWCSFQIF